MDFKVLSKYDDVLTDYFVDKLYLWFQTTRMDAAFEATSDERDEAVQIIQRELLVKSSVVVAVRKAADAFLNLPYFKNLTQEYNTTDLKNFKQHLILYLNMFSPKAGYEIASTIRYTGKMEGCVLATKDWEAGEKVRLCVGTVSILSKEDDQALRNEGRDFSVMISTRYNTARLFLGPAKFMNHDCEANCRFVAEGNTVTFYTTKPINCGEEMTVFYGDHYFGDGNCECRCASCHSNKRGYYAPVQSHLSTTSGSSLSVEPLTPVNDADPPRRSSRKRKAVDYTDYYVVDITEDVLQAHNKRIKSTLKEQKEPSPSKHILPTVSKYKKSVPIQNITNRLKPKLRKKVHPEMELSFICHGTENWVYMPVVEDPAKYTSSKRKRSLIEAELESYKRVCKGLDSLAQEHVLVPDPPLFPFAFKAKAGVSGFEGVLDFTNSSAAAEERHFDQWIDDQSDLSSVRSITSGDNCDCCSQANDFKLVYTPGQSPMCSRCFRHHKIFGSRWPVRPTKPARVE